MLPRALKEKVGEGSVGIDLLSCLFSTSIALLRASLVEIARVRIEGGNQLCAASSLLSPAWHVCASRGVLLFLLQREAGVPCLRRAMCVAALLRQGRIYSTQQRRATRI